MELTLFFCLVPGTIFLDDLGFSSLDCRCPVGLPDFLVVPSCRPLTRSFGQAKEWRTLNQPEAEIKLKNPRVTDHRLHIKDRTAIGSSCRRD